MASLESIGGQLQPRAPARADPGLPVERPQPQRALADERRQELGTTGQILPPEPQTSGEKTHEVQRLRESVAEVISNYSQNISRELRFAVDESRGEVVITVLNDKTNEVIRQIPPKEVLELARKMKESQDEFQKGLLLNLEG